MNTCSTLSEPSVCTPGLLYLVRVAQGPRKKIQTVPTRRGERWREPSPHHCPHILQARIACKITFSLSGGSGGGVGGGGEEFIVLAWGSGFVSLKKRSTRLQVPKRPWPNVSVKLNAEKVRWSCRRRRGCFDECYFFKAEEEEERKRIT